MTKKVFILNYGCSANLADSEIMAGLLKQSGFDLAPDAENSDLNIINTCIVKTPTENRMIFKIKQLTKSGKPLIVAGCMPKTSKSIIEKINPNASLVGPESIEKIVYASIAAIRGNKAVLVEDHKKPKACLPRERKNPLIGVIPVSSGCLSNCSYCSVKLARGELLSYPIEMIIEEVKRSVEDECKEIYLTSQDNSCYGKDTGRSLPELLGEVCKVEGIFYIRVGMLNPLYTKEMLDDLVRSYKNPQVFKFLHLPVQSGSDKILQSMKRGYTSGDFIEIVKKFREEIPRITISTDVIVGFPEETDEDFESTVELIKLARPDIVNISRFGSRTMTEASKMEQLGRKIVNERSILTHKLTKKIALEINRKWIGCIGKVLVDEKIQGGFVGRNLSYKPVIIKTDENIFGKFVNVKIVDATPNCLIGSYKIEE
ncbi:MAG TPA: tRNA (N(6)-L-threonylcarbamoyladenosine(37)-C(2))-methylthiotransferase [archaeon]|nr:tRNA (N(6)-L-threonylcarbamoyladenosine(37)-C(2))-methylthiotransferase [archaeon]